MSEHQRLAEKMFAGLTDARSPALVAADEKVRQLIDDIKQINARNTELLVKCAAKLDENSREFERKVAELEGKIRKSAEDDPYWKGA